MNVPVLMKDKQTGVETVISSIRTAARILDIDKRYIENYIFLKEKKLVLGRYSFELPDKEKYILKRDSYSSLQPTAQKIEVIDVTTNTTTIYPSMTSAGKSLGIRQPCISLYLKNKRTKPYRGK
jgi:hypothetical protein